LHVGLSEKDKEALKKVDRILIYIYIFELHTKCIVIQLDYLDQASVIERRMGGHENLVKEVERMLAVGTYSVACCLLAGLPVHEVFLFFMIVWKYNIFLMILTQVVTTNYNEMFEYASASIGLNCAVLPYNPVPGKDRWILKMHGCVSHPEDIVLTRVTIFIYLLSHLDE
jgi:hypothetical protein